MNKRQRLEYHAFIVDTLLLGLCKMSRSKSRLVGVNHGKPILPTHSTFTQGCTGMESNVCPNSRLLMVLFSVELPGRTCGQGMCV